MTRATILSLLVSFPDCAWLLEPLPWKSRPDLDLNKQLPTGTPREDLLWVRLTLGNLGMRNSLGDPRARDPLSFRDNYGQGLAAIACVRLRS